jgi:hypothetical protein
MSFCRHVCAKYQVTSAHVMTGDDKHHFRKGDVLMANIGRESKNNDEWYHAGFGTNAKVLGPEKKNGETRTVPVEMVDYMLGDEYVCVQTWAYWNDDEYCMSKGWWVMGSKKLKELGLQTKQVRKPVKRG